MYVALIPPRGLENYALMSKFHLALAVTTLIQRRLYGGMYRRAVAKLGDYVVLDNGANEGMLASDEALAEMAASLSCQELVLPDVLYNSDATVHAARGFLQHTQYGRRRCMAVVQGRTMNEVRSCISKLNDLIEVRVLGIPRHLVTTLEKSTVRIDIANWIDKTYPNRFRIHLLGTAASYLKEVQFAVKYAAHIRSVDTSLPFNYAIARTPLQFGNEGIVRPARYFEEDWSTRLNLKLLRDNIYTLMEWANATIRTTDPEAPLSTVRAVSARAEGQVRTQ